MFGAIHNARLYFNRFKKGKINCILTDIYDFKRESYDSIVMFANNYEWLSQAVGASHSYKIRVEMEYKDRKIKAKFV